MTLQFEPWELESAKGCGKRTCMFTKYALQDIGRNPCHFMLAFCSVFVVVLSTLVINTVIEKGPLIFLSLGEKDQGEIDATFSVANDAVYGDYESTYANYVSKGQFYNYTQVTSLYGDSYNLAPRK